MSQPQTLHTSSPTGTMTLQRGHGSSVFSSLLRLNSRIGRPLDWRSGATSVLGRTGRRNGWHSPLRRPNGRWTPWRSPAPLGSIDLGGTPRLANWPRRADLTGDPAPGLARPATPGLLGAHSRSRRRAWA